jgi:hypothetical protein
MEALDEAGLLADIGKENVTENLEEAIARCRVLPAAHEPVKINA